MVCGNEKQDEQQSVHSCVREDEQQVLLTVYILQLRLLQEAMRFSSMLTLTL